MDRIAYIIGETFIFWSPIIVAISALAAACWFIGLYLGRTGKGIAAFLAVPMAFVSSMFFSRVIHWYCRTDSYASFEAAITDYTTGDYALFGVFVGCFVTAAILRLIRVSKNMPEMLDCMAVAGAVGISVSRLSSFFNSSDRGMIMEELRDLPLVYPVTNAVTGEPEYRLATFLLQSMVTAGIFVLLLLFWLTMKKKGRKGDTFLMFSLLYGAAQAVLDSTRYDSLFLRSNGFVSIVQILGAVGMVLAVVWFSVRMVKAWGWRYWFLAFWVGIGGCLGGAGYMEYYVQRHGDQALFAYTVMTGCLLGTILLGAVIYALAAIGENSKKLAERKKQKKAQKAEKKSKFLREVREEPVYEEAGMPVMEIPELNDVPQMPEKTAEAPSYAVKKEFFHEEEPDWDLLKAVKNNTSQAPEVLQPEEMFAAEQETEAAKEEELFVTTQVTEPVKPEILSEEVPEAVTTRAATYEEELFAPDAALENMTTDELLEHLKKVLDGEL